jgi:hypothetical protein
MPGLGWAILLIRTRYNAFEGWWLIALTGLVFTVTMSRAIWPNDERYVPSFITIGLTAVGAAIFIGDSDVVMILQAVILVLFVVVFSESISRNIRAVSMLLATLIAAVLSIILLATFGRWH